jgi:hypothetical protein
MNNVGFQSLPEPADNVDLCRFVDYIIDAGFLSEEYRMRLSTKSSDELLSSFAPLLSESLAVVLFPGNARGKAQPSLHVDVSQTLYRMWCGFEESSSSLTAVAADIVAEDGVSHDYLVPFKNGMALQSCAEADDQSYTAVTWLHRVLNRCVRRLLRHSFTNLAAQCIETAEISCSSCQGVDSTPDDALSLAATARRLSSEGELPWIPVDINGHLSSAGYHIEDVPREVMVMTHRDNALSSRQPDIVTSHEEVSVELRLEAMTSSFCWAAPTNDVEPVVGRRPLCCEARRTQQAVSSGVPVSTSTCRLRPEGPFSAALWCVPDWAVTGESAEPRQQQHGWRR